MAAAMKLRTPCSVCHKDRYVEPPVPKPYVCKRCTATARVAKVARAVTGTKAPVGESRDPWLNDNIRKREINAQSERGSGGWIPRREGWMRRER